MGTNCLKAFCAALWAAGFVIISGCSAPSGVVGTGGKDGAVGGASPVATVTVSPRTASLVVGGTQQLTASAYDAAGAALTGRAVTWSSAAPTVASVSATGLVTAVAAGAATVTATVEGKTASAALTVTPVPIATVTVSPAAASLMVGGTRQLTATAYDAAGVVLTGRAVTWSSGTPTVATISATGLVTAVAAGTATVTAMVEGKTASASLTVTPIPIATVIVSPSSVVLDVGGNATLVASARDAAGNVLTGRSIVWSSTNPAVATVSSNGTVTGNASGATTVRASVEGVVGESIVGVRLASGTPRLTVTVRGLPTATARARVQISQTGSGASFNQYPDLADGATASYLSAPAGTYYIGAAAVGTTVNGLSFSYQPDPPTRTVTVSETATTAVTLDYVLSTGAVAATVAGLPAGVSSSCSLQYTMLGGGTSGVFIGLPSGTPTSLAVPGSGAATLLCNVVIANGIEYAPVIASQVLTIPRSTTPLPVTIEYRQPSGTPRLTVTVRGLPTATARARVQISQTGSGASFNQYPDLADGATASYLSAPAGTYYIGAAAVGTTVNGLSFSYQPDPPTRTVTVSETATTAVTLDYVLSTGAVAATVAGLPAGVSSSCSLQYTMLGGGTSGVFIGLPSGTPTSLAVPGSGAATLLCNVVIANGIEYAPVIASRALIIPRSTTPLPVTIEYRRP